MPKLMYKDKLYGGEVIQKVELTQAEYDALTAAEKSADILYLISDGDGGNTLNLSADEISYGNGTVEDKLDIMTSRLHNFGESVTIQNNIEEPLITSFNNATDYTIFQGTTMNGVEAGWIGFKHNNSKPAYGLLFSAAYGVLIWIRSETGTFSYRRVFLG